MNRLCKIALAAMALMAISVFVPSQAAFAQSDLRQGAVYVQTDGSAQVVGGISVGNEVIAFFRHADGTLTEAGRFATGGSGTGAHLVSAGSVTLATVDGNQFLYVINTATSDISVFSVQATSLSFLQRIASGTVRPGGVTVHDHLLYAVGEASANIVGFRIGSDGLLTVIPGSSRTVNGTVASEPFQVLFDNTGTLLAVSDENINAVSTFVVDPVTGLAQGPIFNNAFGVNPFGMIFDQFNHLFVTAGGFDVPNVSDMSSFTVNPGGTLQVVSPNVLNHRQFECWIAITSDAGNNGGHYGYTDNTGDSTISSYFVKPDGSITLINSVAATVPGSPLAGIVDNGMSPDSKFFYAASFLGSVNVFAIQPDGGLVTVQNVQGLPVGMAGMAVR
ncbi:MAG TPA: beta-propeller fold lactonase family protein [Candidatus Saccharimonadales bacterium]|jgi:6-phosphogluconolactonase|nr:beta-propeller fold lactonase family protein [Candidatus Saccharimonadales bacterium]